MNKNKLFLIILILVFLVAFGVRIFYIYNLPPCVDEDSCTIGLMAWDVLKGKIPVFFPGQDYNGPLEAFWLSLFIAIFGFSTTTLCIGMTCLYIFYAVTIYWMGKLLGGRYIGLWALMYCAIPPNISFHYSVLPYGYFAVLLIFGNLVIIYTLLITKDEKSQKNIIYWMLLGIFAGLGFYSHFSIIYYLISAGLFLLINVKIKNMIKNGLIGLTFFLIGSLPFWIYNFFTNFSSFDIYDGRPYRYVGVDYTYSDVLRKILFYHLPNILGILSVEHILGYAAWAVFILIGVLFVVIPDKSKKTLWLFLFISIIAIFSTQKYFVRSPFSYYLLPMYSVLPIWVAYVVSWLNKKLKYSGIFLLIIILIFNAYTIPRGLRGYKNEFSNNYRNYAEAIKTLSLDKIQGVVGDFILTQSITYLSSGKIIGTEPVNGRSGTEIDVQGMDRVAILIKGALKPSINMLCKDYKEDGFYYGFTNYGYFGKAISPKYWKSESNYESYDTKYSYDRNLDKRWGVSRDRKLKAYYEVDLGKTYNVYRLVIYPFTWDFPVSYRVKVSADGVHWKTVQRSTNPHPFFWSGARLYWEFINSRMEILFRPTKARYVRIEEIRNEGKYWIINEIFIYECLGQKERGLKDYIKSAKKVYSYLLKNKIRFVYSDFWLSGKIRKWAKGKMDTLQISNEGYPFRENTNPEMRLNSSTAIVINREMQEETERILGEFNISIDKKRIGDYVCYFFAPAGKDRGWQDYFFKYQDCLYWAWICPVKKSLKSYSQVLTSYGLKLEREGDMEGAVKYYKKALEIYPRNNLAREAMADYYKNKGYIREYKKELLKLKHLCFPLIKKRIEFENGATFLGYRIFRFRNILRIDYYWKTQKKLRDCTFVFVYFIKDGNIVFQGDYPMPFEYPNPVISLKDWVFVERSSVKIPIDAKSGAYEIVMGLHMPYKNGRRVRIKGSKRVNKVNVGEYNL